MGTQTLAALARDLRDCLVSGALAGLGRVEMGDGAVVDAERMARIILADVAHLTHEDRPPWLTDREVRTLYDDLLHLLALTRAPGTRGASERPAGGRGQCCWRGRADAACRAPSDSAARRS